MLLLAVWLIALGIVTPIPALSDLGLVLMIHTTWNGFLISMDR